MSGTLRYATSRRLALALALVAVLTACTASPSGPTPPAPSDDPTALRVMTWNVQTGGHDPAEWADVVARLRPDVLALQEICAGEVRELADLLRRDHGLDYIAVPGPIRPPPGEAGAEINAALGPVCGTAPDAVAYGLGVLSLLPASDPAVALFPPDRRDEQRGYLTVRVSRPGRAALTVVTSHVGLAGVAGGQIRRLADAASRADPVVVLGDLNVGVTAPELAPLRRAFTEVDPKGSPPDHTALGKIDYVFARGCRVVGSRDPETDASDHRPLLVDLAG